MSPKHKLMFIHIPKAAGSSIIISLLEHYSLTNALIIPGPYYEANAQQLSKLPNCIKKRTAAILGHMSFGLHSYFDQPGQNCKYFTILRDPVDRLLSYYDYVLASPKHPAYTQYRKKNVRMLEHVETSADSSLCNLQVRMISGKKNALERVTREDLSRAKENIEGNFVGVGTVSLIRESMTWLAQHLDWRSVTIPLSNKTVRQYERSPNSELGQRLREVNSLDVELYEWCEQRLRQQLASVNPIKLVVKEIDSRITARRLYLRLKYKACCLKTSLLLRTST